MSDTPQGEGWWQASDGKWYPPQQQPGTPAAGGAGYAGGTPGGMGQPGTLEVGAAISYGWNKFVQYIGQIILIVLIIFGVNIVINVVSQGVDSIALSLVVSIAGFIISMILQLGLIRVGLRITEGQKPEVSMLFETDHLGPYILASILFGIGILLGLIALCIGALVVAFFLWFYGFFIVDQNQDAVESLTSSFNLVKNNIGQVLVFALVAIILNVVTCGLASAIVMIATAYAYKVLTGQQVAA
jgi:uncharacterized membrane protein